MAILTVNGREFELTEDRAITLEAELASLEPGGVVTLDLTSASGRRISLRVPHSATTHILFDATWAELDAEADSRLAASKTNTPLDTAD